MTGLYDLHTHTILSDGEMLPSELVRRMAVLGYTTVAITDHVDTSNAASVVRSLLDVRESARLFGSGSCAVSRSRTCRPPRSPRSPGGRVRQERIS